MAKYIVKQDIDFDICTSMCNQGRCLIEKAENDGIDSGLDMCMECVKIWFSEEE